MSDENILMIVISGDHRYDRDRDRHHHDHHCFRFDQNILSQVIEFVLIIAIHDDDIIMMISIMIRIHHHHHKH